MDEEPRQSTAEDIDAKLRLLAGPIRMPELRLRAGAPDVAIERGALLLHLRDGTPATRMTDRDLEAELVRYVLELPRDCTFNLSGWEISRGLFGPEAEAVRPRLEKKLAELEATGHLRPSGTPGCWVKTTESSDYGE